MNANAIVEKLAEIQGQIWQTASGTVTDAANQSITLASPLTVLARTADLYAEMTVPMMVIQFAFASLPDNPQVILIPQETVTALAEQIQGSSVEEIDENIVADLRPALEGLVQGICLAINNLRNEMMVASGLSIRYQIFSFPPNLQRDERVVRTQVAVSGDEASGSLIWLLDMDTANFIVGDEAEATADAPFQRIGNETAPSASAGPRGLAFEEANQLELLLDIPLEISVELGRVKMLVKDVLDLASGSILEIDKAAGEPVDVLVNGRLMARGEVVVIEDNFGVRITEIVNPNERANVRPGEAA